MVYHSFMDVANLIHTEPWINEIPDMVQYANYMKQYEGWRLNDVNITLNRLGPRNRLNVVTWYFQERDPSAFYCYDIDYTPIDDRFLHRASALAFKYQEPKIPQWWLYRYHVSSLRNLP